MHKKVFAVFLIFCYLIAAAGCTKNVLNTPAVPAVPAAPTAPAVPAVPQEPPKADESNNPSITGIHLGDSKFKVEEILGKNHKEKIFEEAEHFLETFYLWTYEEGYTITIGRDTNTVLQIEATSPQAISNLNVKIGDSADKILTLYRAKYTEPVSIHGPKLLGVFKVEKGQAIFFDFNKEDGFGNGESEMKADAKLERMILTYPNYMDDSF